MITYAGTFAAGFEKIIPLLLSESVEDCRIINLESALVLFTSSRILEENTLPFFINLFVCITVWQLNTMSFADMKNKIDFNAFKKLEPFLQNKKTFRLRFSKENQFCSVDKNLVTSLENAIKSRTDLVPDRLNSKTEFHFIIRRECLSLSALKLTEKSTTEKTYEKGELRNETVRLMLFLSGLNDEDYVICDPFAGYGSIPRQIALQQPYAHLYINDVNPNLAECLKKEFNDTKNFTVTDADACALRHIEKNTVNLIVTDPPWGSFDSSLTTSDISVLYVSMLKEFERILVPHGRAVILTGAKAEFENAVLLSSCFSSSAKINTFKTDILVNGKKASVYCISKEY